MEINSNAPIVSRHEIAINAPLESVWRVFTDIDSWPEWNPDIPKSKVGGPIEVGTVIHWETAGMVIPSTIGEVVPLKRIGWSGETKAFSASTCVSLVVSDAIINTIDSICTFA
jgi:uncharacterized protein YndB with AHSA1/START domain